jgi:hypothetical protein
MSEQTFNLRDENVIRQAAMALEAACRENICGVHETKVIESDDADRRPRIQLRTTESNKVDKMLFELLPPVLAKQKEILDYSQLLLQERLEVKEYGEDWAKHIKTSKEAAFLGSYLTKYYENPWVKLDPVIVHTTDDSTMYAVFDFTRIRQEDLETAVNTLAAILTSRNSYLIDVEILEEE